MKLISNLSGSMIYRIPFAVIKTGGVKVAEQGARMRDMPHCAKVYCIGKTWYAMQKLDDKYGKEYSQHWPSMASIDMLHDIWSRSWWHPPSWETNLTNLLEDWKSPLLPYVRDAADAIRDDRECMVHGDPTWENMVWSHKENKWKFIDPLTPRHYLPSHPVVDMGKLGQTFRGWEYLRYGWRFSKLTRSGTLCRLQCLPHYEWTWFWTALAFERIEMRCGHADYVTSKFCRHERDELIKYKRLDYDWAEI